MSTRQQPPVTYSPEEIAAQLAALGIAESPEYLDMPWMGPINYSWSAERALKLYRERFNIEPNVCHCKPSFWLLGRSEGVAVCSTCFRTECPSPHRVVKP